jgi:hypothetical protein
MAKPDPALAPVTGSAVELARRLRDFDEYVDACDEAANWIETADARIKQLEDCLSVIEKRLREDTVPILELIKTSGNEEVKRAWKSAIYASCIRAQVFLPLPNAKLRDAAQQLQQTPTELA